MKKKGRLFFWLLLCGMLGLTGCRQPVKETETETQSETISETETETETESETQKQTERKTNTPATEKQSETNKKTTTKKTNVNPVTSTTETTETNTSSAYGTQQCPYCYQQISLAPNEDGGTVYSAHVAQEKAWADYMSKQGETSSPSDVSQTPSTEAPQTNTSDVQQCGYCYQWFSVSDGSYAAHLASENASLGMPEGTEYIQCPLCGYSFPKGSVYDNHVCEGRR